MTVKRDGNTALVTCSHSNAAWQLVCEGMQWRGQLGNCSEPGSFESLFKKCRILPLFISVEECHEKGVFGCSKFPYSKYPLLLMATTFVHCLNSLPGILLVVAIGVALGVFLGGLLLVCASRYLRRYGHL
jgi:hypothetical protein